MIHTAKLTDKIVIAEETMAFLFAKPEGFEFRRINPEMIRHNCKEWRDAVYYVAGSSGMVDGIRAMLSSMEIKAERIRKEKFTGY